MEIAWIWGLIFRAWRYGEGKDYLNCPMTSEEYYRFVDELCKGEEVPYREFERPVHFEGCLPSRRWLKGGEKRWPMGH